MATTHRAIRVRTSTQHRSTHPPFGLFVEPHGRGHSWWAVDPRTLIGFTSVLTALGALLSIVAR